MIRSASNRGAPSMAVSTISATSTRTPKNSENQSATRKTSDLTLRSRLLPVAIVLSVTSRAGVVAVLISRPA